MKMRKATIFQVLIFIASVEFCAVASSGISDHDNTTKLELTTLGVLNVSDSDSTTVLPNMLENATTTEDPKSILIPPATVVAQIVNADVPTKKPSRLMAAAS